MSETESGSECSRCAELEADLRMVRSGRDAFKAALEKLQSEIANRKRGHPKRQGSSRE